MIITNINITLKASIVPLSQTPPSKSTKISDKAPPQTDKEAIPNKSIETPPDTPVQTYPVSIPIVNLQYKANRICFF